MTDELDVRDFRLHQRYIFDRPVTANYESLDVTVTNISAAGLQIEHADPLKLRIVSRISIPLARPTLRAELRGEVRWSHLSQNPNVEGKYLYRSGVRLDETQENALAVERLMQIYPARADGESLQRKRQILRRKQGLAMAGSPPVQPLKTYTSAIEPDRKLLIRQLCERLKQNPDELKLLAQRGRSALSDRADSVLYSDEVLAVWEYLQRGVSLEDIEQVLSKKSSSQ